MRITYHVDGAWYAGVTGHPEKVFKAFAESQGRNITDSQPLSVFSVWLFEVDGNLSGLPGYMTELKGCMRCESDFDPSGGFYCAQHMHR